MAINDGRVYVITGEGFTYAGQISGSFDGTNDLIEITTKDSTNGAKEYIYGEYGGTIALEGLNDWADSDGFSRPFGQWLNKTQVTLLFGYASSGNQLSCEGLISNISLTGSKNEAAGYSATFTITGDITEQAV